MYVKLLVAAAASALLVGAAAAQSDQQPSAQTDVTAQTPPADQSAPAGATDTTGYNSRVVLPASSTTLGDSATLKAGDTGVVSNGPVADTPENRAKYGKPDSNAGKRTAPRGN